MTLPLLIVIALAVPTLLLLVAYLFARSIPWLGARPRLLAGLEILIGTGYLLALAFEARGGFETWHITSLILGVGFFGGGLHRWFRGVPVQFE